MKSIRIVMSAVLIAILAGCGKGDLNKDLKPIDPNTVAPKPGSEKSSGSKDKPATPP